MKIGPKNAYIRLNNEMINLDNVKFIKLSNSNSKSVQITEIVFKKNINTTVECTSNKKASDEIDRLIKLKNERDVFLQSLKQPIYILQNENIV